MFCYSGGLLIALKQDTVKDFCQEIKEIDGWDAHVIGEVISGQKDANVVENPNIIECSI